MSIQHSVIGRLRALGRVFERGAVALGAARVRPAAPVGSPRRRIAMVAHNYYPIAEPRLTRQATTLWADWDIDIICLNNGSQPARESAAGMRIFRVPIARDRTRSLWGYFVEYIAFACAAGAGLALLGFRQRYDIVQLYNYPDFLVFAALVPKLLGARIILDMRDLMPEFYSVRTGLPLAHPAIVFLKLVERWSAGFADHVSVAGEPFRSRLIANGLRASKATSIMNSADDSLFFRRPQPARRARPFVLSYHGILSEYTDIEVVCEALAEIRAETPGLEFWVHGYGRTLPALQARIAALGLADCVKLMSVRPLAEIAQVIGGVDLGIASQAPSVFTQMNYPQKAFEYIASGVPVLLSRSPALMQIFPDDDRFFFEPGHAGQIAKLVLAHYRDSRLRQSVWETQNAAYWPMAWPNEVQRFRAMIDAVAEHKRAGAVLTVLQPPQERAP